MHHLVITVFEFAVDVHILDVEAGEVLKDFVFAPGIINIGPISVRVHIGRDILDFDLFLKVIHRFAEL